MVTDITDGIRSANHGGLDAAECERQCVSMCAECSVDTAGGDKVVMFRKVDGEVEYLCEKCYGPHYFKENKKELTHNAFEQMSRMMAGRAKLSL